MSASKYILILLLLFPSVAYGAVITIDTNMSADATIAGFNNNFSILSDWANGDVEGSGVNLATTNILADSVGELDMGDDANPRVRDSELFSIGDDTSTAGTLVQTSYVSSGLVFADDGSGFDASWTAGTAYINGYRVTKESGTFNDSSTPALTASKDNYIDLEQDGDWHITAVALGATAPAVFANSARIAKIVTGAADVTSATDLANRRLATLIIPVAYRNNMIISRDSTTTLHVDIGDVEIDDTMVSKSTGTTLTVATATDWADGTANATVDKYRFIGVDADGNIKWLEDLDTATVDGPTHSDYDLSSVLGVKRYATEDSTTYRIIGWAYFNSALQIAAAEVGNIRDGGVPNTVISSDDADRPATSGLADFGGGEFHFYSTGRPVVVTFMSNWNDGDDELSANIKIDGTTCIGALSNAGKTPDGDVAAITSTCSAVMQQGTHTIQAQVGTGADAKTITNSTIVITEF